jgi:secreted trypsin-like serine protease
MKSRLGLFTVIAAAAPVWGCAIEPEADIDSDQEAIINGAPVTNHSSIQYKTLVAITTTDPADGDSLRCSGTLIAKRFVLTAGHCAIRRDASTLHVNFGTEIPALEDRQVNNVKNAWVHPDYTENPSDLITDWFGGDDIALLELKSNAPRDKQALAPFPLEQWDPLVGSEVVVSGYGMTENLGQIFAGEGTLDVLYTTAITLDHFETPTARGEKIVANTADTGVCFGDSGGPMMARLDDDRRGHRNRKADFVVGVTSEVFDADYTFDQPIDNYECVGADSYAGFTEVAPYVGWLSTTARHNFYDDALEQMDHSKRSFTRGELRQVRRLADQMDRQLRRARHQPTQTL